MAILILGEEWDYYYILNKDFGITFTMSDLGYTGLFAVAWLDFENKTCTQFDTMSILPRGKTGFPSDSRDGVIDFKDKKIALRFEYNGPKRVITIDCPKFRNSKGETGLKGTLILHQDPNLDTMVIATSWKKNCGPPNFSAPSPHSSLVWTADTAGRS